MAFAKFMAQPAGRIIRIVAGVALIAVGLLVVQGVWGVVLTVAGVLPVAAGAFNFCTIAPILAAPFWGDKAA